MTDISKACASGAHMRCHASKVSCEDSCHAYLTSTRDTPRDEARERLAELRAVLRGAA